MKWPEGFAIIRLDKQEKGFRRPEQWWNKYMKEECLICKAPLEYLKEDMEMECE